MNGFEERCPSYKMMIYGFRIMPPREGLLFGVGQLLRGAIHCQKIILQYLLSSLGVNVTSRDRLRNMQETARPENT
jgi:hypothetical protein